MGAERSAVATPRGSEVVHGCECSGKAGMAGSRAGERIHVLNWRTGHEALLGFTLEAKGAVWEESL